MSAPGFTIRKDNLPTRCEICHQNDLFDADENICQRCHKIDQFSFTSAHQATSNQLNKNDQSNNSPRISQENVCFFGFAGLFCGVIIAALLIGVRELMIDTSAMTAMQRASYECAANVAPLFIIFVGALGFMAGISFGVYLEIKTQN